MLAVEYTILDGEIIAEATPTSYHDLLIDPLGSVIGRIDSSQAITEPREFWPYGQQASGTAPAIGALTFVGSQGYMVDHAGFYVRMRTYVDDLGAWRSLDPLWPEESSYQYCKSSPTFVIDPYGMSAENETLKRKCDEQYDKCKGNVALLQAILLTACGLMLIPVAPCFVACMVPPATFWSCIACIAPLVPFLLCAALVIALLNDAWDKCIAARDVCYRCASQPFPTPDTPYQDCVNLCSALCKNSDNPAQCFARCKKWCSKKRRG